MTNKQKFLFFPYAFVLYEIAIYLSNDMYLPSMPAIAKDLFFSQEQIQYTLTFWFLGASSLQFILGPLSDSYGRRYITIINGILYVISSAACAMSASLPILLLARFMQGATICALIAGYAAIHEMYSTKQAIKILAFTNAVSILAPAFGPLFGALLVQFATWRYIFWLLTVLGIVSTILLFIVMPESNHNKHKLVFRVFMRDYVRILLNKDFMLACISYCLLVSVFFIWMFEAPFLLIEVYKKSNLFYGIAQTAVFSCFFLGAWFTKIILSRLSLKQLLSIGTAIAVCGAILLAMIAKMYDEVVRSVICMMLLSTGASMLFAPINRIAIESCTEPMGRRTAVISTILSLFGALCGWILAMVQAHSLVKISLLITACIALSAILLVQIKVPELIED